jgi:hypothetical protein
MFFSDWKQKSQGAKISPRLLWEYDLEQFDWDAMRTLVMQRVIERGWPNDFYAAIRLYGGLDKVREIIKEIPVLSLRDMAFACALFKINKEEMKCYTWKQSREKRLNSLAD